MKELLKNSMNFVQGGITITAHITVEEIGNKLSN